MSNFDTINDNELYLGNCVLTDIEKKLAKENPHCTEFFCNLSNILNCTKCFKKLSRKLKPNYQYKNQRENALKKDQTDKCEKCESGFFYELMPHRFESFSKIDKDTISEVDKYKIIKNFYSDKLYYELEDIPYIIKYDLTSPKPKSVVHWGQIKMFLVLLIFLIKKIDPKEKEVHIIYPGSACGDNILILCSMFPNTIWYLVDPSPFNKGLYKHKQIKEIKNEFFTNDTANYYKKLFANRKHPLLLLSDIRVDTSDESVMQDQANQADWHRIINPDFSYLKFRCPYDNPRKYKFYEGKILLQPFAPVGSTESRIIFSGELKEKVYDIDEYQGKFYYFNRVLRPSYYKKALIEKNSYFDHCYDCTYFSYLIQNYLNKFGDINPYKTTDVLKIMKEITNTITKSTMDKIDIYNKMIRQNIL